MRISDSFSEQPEPTNKRLYTGVVSKLNTIKFLGFFGSFLGGIAWGQGSFIRGGIVFIILVLATYVVLQSSIVIIDLLSRIEYNTRKE